MTNIPIIIYWINSKHYFKRVGLISRELFQLFYKSASLLKYRRLDLVTFLQKVRFRMECREDGGEVRFSMECGTYGKRARRTRFRMESREDGGEVRFRMECREDGGEVRCRMECKEDGG